MSEGQKGLVAAGALAVIVAAVLVACYLGNWWLFSDSVNRQGRIRQDSFEHQQGLIADAQAKEAEVSGIDVQISAVDGDSKTALINQRTAIVTRACSSINQITETLPNDLVSFKAKEHCS